MNFLTSIIKHIGIALISLGTLFAGHSFQAGTTFTPVQCAQTTLSGAGITSSATTIPVTAFTNMGGSITLTQAMFGTTGYATLEPNNPSKTENISFTGITQNANGTASLTGVTRGLDFVSPYQASTTLQKAHSGGQYLICSNSAPFYGQFALLNNPQTFPSLNTFTDPPIVTNSATATNQLASVSYVNGIAFGSTPVLVPAGGTGQTQFASGAILVGNGSGNILASSSPTVNFITATSSSGTSNFNGNVTINGTLTAPNYNNVLGSSTISTTLNVGTVNATSSINLNGVAIKPYLRTISITTGTNTTSSASTTLASITIPANTLVANNVLKIDAEYEAHSTATCNYAIQFGTGNATSTYAAGLIAANSTPDVNLGSMNVNIYATTTTGQIGFGNSYNLQTSAALGNSSNITTGASVLSYVLANMSAYNITAQTYVAFQAKMDTGSGGCFLDTVNVGVYSQ